ncbi:DUF1542 domain-containing protein [Fructobacillus fructosus]|uniref:DUF1542 domain-containing protein n=1 Tax=Fructobacillus fructosus TaxID=1631 RepID=UPI00200B58DB|nr:DUF1542 domain-containing protein [Fructobacillus fructosus]MCK8638921.1 DUF1542 domain-containing protein [Fructobacillus fructosus]
MNTRVDKFQKRTHYKMYKAGKRWLVAGMATFALASAGQIVTGHAPINFGQDIIVHAADSSTNYWFGQNADYYKRYTELPGQTSIPQSLQQKWGYAGAEIPKLQEQTNLKFDSLSYDTTTGLYTLTIKMNVPVLATNGAGRTSYLDLGFSDSLSAKTAGIPSLIAANGNPGTLAANGNGVFSNNFSAGSYVGGTSTVSIQINPVKIQKNDEISVMYSSDTGTTGYHAIFSTVRTMGYNEFGLQFNQTLLKQMKTNSTNNISSSKLSTKQKVAEQAKVDSVTTDDDFVNKLQDIDKEIDTKSKANAVPIDTQRATALQQYKDAHHVDEWLAKIKNDPTLTFDQKTAQSKQIEDALAIINGNLGNATDSDDVAAVIADTSQDDVIASAYKPGVDLASQIKSAQAAVDEQVAKSKELVDNNNALTEAEKSTQNSTIDAIGTAVKNNIATKASADDINATQAAGVKNLTDLDTAKPNAYTTLTDKAKAAIATINNDENLTDAEKATKKSQVTDALKKLTDQIDQDTDASVIDSLKNSPDLDTAIATATSNKGITPIGTRREDANRQINQAVSDTKAKINQDPTLTTQEKATQSANVDKAAAEAKAAIASGSAQVVADAVSKAQGEIAGSYVAGKPLPDRQQDAEKDLQATAETAKHNLDDQVAQTNNDVNNNHYLTDDEKAAQKQAIEKAAEAILAKINNATNADDINTLLNDGKSVVGNLNSQKLDARTTINNAAQGAKAKINNNNALTADEKRERVNQIEAAQTAANQAVDAATDADVIAKIPANGSDFDKSVKNATDFSNVTSLNDQQANAGAAVTDAGQKAKDALDAAKTASENAINQDGSLTFEQKAMQKTAIDAAVTNAKRSIASTTNADDVVKARDLAVAAISKMTSDKVDARQSLAKNAQDAIDKINQYDALTSDEKRSRVQQIQDAYDKATTAVDSATDSQVIASVKDATGFTNTVAKATDFSNVLSLADQKTAADKQIDDITAVIKANIDADTNLSSEDKTTQKSTIDAVAASKKNVIDSATNADGIVTAKNVAVQTINGLDKTNADKAVSDQASSAHAAINGNPALTQAQKDAFNKQIDAAKQTVQDNVNQVTDSSTVASLIDSQNSDYAKQLQNVLTQAGQALSIQAQQTAANQAIDTATTATKAKVDADSLLTDADKQAQKDALDIVANQAKTAIQQAATADTINQAQTNGINALDSLDKTNAGKAASHQASSAHAKINDNPALTQAQKDAFNKQIDDAKQTVQDNINKATDASTVVSLVSSQNSDYAKQLQNILTNASSTPSLDIQKTTASQAIDDAANTVKSDVDADQSNQKAVIDAQASNAKQAVQNANNADEVNQAQTQGIQSINDLANAKKSASQAVKDDAQKARDVINNSPVLTTVEKANRNKQIDAAVTNAQNAIDQATTPDDVNQVVSDTSEFKTSLAASVDTSQVPSIQAQQTAANQAIDAAKAVAEAKVDADSSITAADKQAQKDALDAVANQAKTAIQQAATADTINQVRDNGTDALNSLDKTNADKAVSDQASSAHVKINGNPALTQVQKDAFNKQIDDAEQTAQSNVNNATDSSTVASLIDSQNSDYAKQLQNVLTQAGQALSIQAQQTAANQAIDNTNTAAKAKVDADPALADADKQAQKATLDKVANQAKQAVQQAATADAVNQAQVDGVNALNRLDKAKADETIASKAKDASDQVNNNPALSDNEKANRNDKIKAAIREVQDKVNQATTPEEVNAAIADTSDFSSVLANATNMDNIETIAQQQTDAKKAIDAANATAKAKVDADTNLSDADKAAQKATLDSLANAAKQNIQNAQTANDITKAQNTGVKSLNDLDKTTADKQLSDKVAQAHATVNSDNDLLQAEKDARNQAIDAATKTVQDTINKATTLDDIAKALANGADFDSAINKASSTTEVKPLAVQKATAAKAINDAVDTARAKIKADSNLSDADKKAQAATIDDLANKAKANIDAATNADGVVAAKTTGVGSITNLDKTSVDANLAKQAQVAHAEVNNNPALSSAEKQRRNQAIDDAAKAAQDVVNKATTIDDANTVISSGNTLDNALKSATSSDGVKTIAGQQVDAGTEIDNAAAKAKQAIDADKTLTDVDKQAQKDVINSQADMFKKAINAANNADDISKNTAAGVKFLQDLTDAKTQANAKLASDVQNAHDAVNNNKTLSQAQKDARNKQIEDAKTAAQDVINKATTLDGVDGALADGSDYDKAMKNAQDISNVSSVADQQKAAIVAIQQAADAAKQVVNADTNLSDTDKQAQKDALDIVANQAKTAIQQAATADDINQAQDNGINALSNMDKTANDKSAAKQATDAHATINGNPALTQAQKDGFNKQIDNAKNAAQEIVNKATDPSTASAAVDTLNSDYAKQLQNILTNASSIPSLDSQKTTANQAIDNAANTVKSGIDADKNLSDADKTAQKTVVDSQVTAAKQAIADANDADNVNTAQAQGVKAINDLANVKTSADDMIVKAAKTAHDAINNNPALSTAEKASRNAAIDTAASKVQGVVNQATTPDAVNAAIADSSEFKVALTTATDTNGVETIEQQQADAKKAIDAANATAKAKVDTDTNLSDADKAAQKATLDSLANAAKQNIQNAQTADDITKAQNVGVKALQDLTNAKTEANAKLASDVQNAHDAVNTNKALTTAQKAERNQAIDEAQKNTQDAINQATTPSSAKNAGLNIADSLAKVIATDGIPSVAEQQKAAIAAIQQTADQAKQTIDVDKTLTGAQKNDQKAAIDDIVKSATDAINQAMDADSINKIQINMTDALNNIHDQKADALSKLQKQADDANHAIDANNALTTDQKQAAHEAVAKALTNAQAVTDHTTNAEDVVNSGNQAAYNKAFQDIADDLAKVPSLVDQVHAAIEKLTEAVNKAKDALSGPDAGAQKMALEKVLSDGTAKLNAQTNADDLKKTLVDVLNTVNGLNQSKTDALTDLDTQSKKATDTVNADPSFTDDEKATRVAAVAKALQDAHDAINEAIDLPGVDAARKATAFSETLKDATSDAGVQTLADRKTDAKKTLQDAADKTKSAIDADKTLTIAQKTAQKQAINQALKIAQNQVDAATTATKVDVSKATNLPTFDALNKAKSDAHQTENKTYNDTKKAIQNNNDLTDAEKQVRISDLDKAHQLASDAIDQAVTPDEIKTANETTAFDNAVKSATDFSKVTPLAERKQAGVATINAAEQKAIDEVNANPKLDADAKTRQIAVLKQQAQAAIAKLDDQSNAQAVVDFIPTVVPTFEKLNQSKVDARARLQNNAATTKAAIDADDNLSDAEKQAQKDAVDAALKQALTNVDNGQDVLTINGIPDGSTAVKKINQGHVPATKTPAQQAEELNGQIDDQAAKIKAEIDADVTLKATDKAAQKQAVDNFVTETKAKIAGLTKYQDRLDVTSKALASLNGFHHQGKPLAEQKADAIAIIRQKADQIRAQIANDSRLTQAQKDIDYQLVEGAVAKAKSQVNAALNADEIVAGLDYGTVQLEAAYQQKVQEQYDEKQSTTPETISVLPQTGETEKKHEEALVAEALVDSMAGFFLSKMNRRRQCEK